MDLAIRDGTDELRVGKCESRGAKPAVKIVWEDLKGNQIDSGVLKSSFRGKLKDTVNELVLVDVDKAKHHQAARTHSFVYHKHNYWISINNILTGRERVRSIRSLDPKGRINSVWAENIVPFQVPKRSEQKWF